VSSTCLLVRQARFSTVRLSFLARCFVLPSRSLWYIPPSYPNSLVRGICPYMSYRFPLLASYILPPFYPFSPRRDMSFPPLLLVSFSRYVYLILSCSCRLRRGLFERSGDYLLLIPTVIDYLNLVTDLMRTHRCGQFRGSIDILIIYLNDNVTCP